MTLKVMFINVTFPFPVMLGVEIFAIACVILLNVKLFYCYAEYILLNGIILGVVSGIFILSVVMLSDGLLSVEIFIAEPSDILLKVIMPSVVI